MNQKKDSTKLLWDGLSIGTALLLLGLGAVGLAQTWRGTSSGSAAGRTFARRPAPALRDALGPKPSASALTLPLKPESANLPIAAEARALATPRAALESSFNKDALRALPSPAPVERGSSADDDGRPVPLAAKPGLFDSNSGRSGGTVGGVHGVSPASGAAPAEPVSGSAGGLAGPRTALAATRSPAQISSFRGARRGGQRLALGAQPRGAARFGAGGGGAASTAASGDGGQTGPEGAPVSQTGASNGARTPTPPNLAPPPASNGGGRGGPLPGTVGGSGSSSGGAPAGQTGGRCYAKGSARCSAYTCAASDAAGIAEHVDAYSKEGLGHLVHLLSEVQDDVDGRHVAESRFLEKVRATRFECEGCEGLNTCLAVAAYDVSAVVESLESGKSLLNDALSTLGERSSAGARDGLPPDYTDVWPRTKDAIAQERAAVDKIKGHAAKLGNAAENCSAGIPRTIRVCRGRQDNGEECWEEPNVKGEAAKAAFTAIVQEDIALQAAALVKLEKGWCERHSCAEIGVQPMLQRIDDAHQAIREWDGEVPATAGEKFADAKQDLTDARPFLSAPKTDSTFLPAGTLLLSRASRRAAQGAKVWEDLKNSACSQAGR